MSQTSSSRRLGAGRVAFIALKATAEQEIAAGHTVAAIYDRYRERIPVSYDQFRHYVAREITRTLGSRSGRRPEGGGSGERRRRATAEHLAPPASAAVAPTESTTPGEQGSDYAPIGSSEWRRRQGIPEPRRDTGNVFVPRHIDLAEAFLGRKCDEADGQNPPDALKPEEAPADPGNRSSKLRITPRIPDVNRLLYGSKGPPDNPPDTTK